MRSKTALAVFLQAGIAFASAQELMVKVIDRQYKEDGKKMQSETYKILGIMDKPKAN